MDDEVIVGAYVGEALRAKIEGEGLGARTEENAVGS